MADERRTSGQGPGGERMTAAEFEALCKMIWGDQRTGWQRSAAGFLGVSLRNVQFFAAEPPAASKPVPYGVARELAAEVQRRVADPQERARMSAWVERHAGQLRAMVAALGQLRAMVAALGQEAPR